MYYNRARIITLKRAITLYSVAVLYKIGSWTYYKWMTHFFGMSSIYATVSKNQIFILKKVHVLWQTSTLRLSCLVWETSLLLFLHNLFVYVEIQIIQFQFYVIRCVWVNSPFPCTNFGKQVARRVPAALPSTFVLPHYHSVLVASTTTLNTGCQLSTVYSAIFISTKCEIRTEIRFLNAKKVELVNNHYQLCKIYGENCMSVQKVRF